jgi:hypothetical protein
MENRRRRRSLAYLASIGACGIVAAIAAAGFAQPSPSPSGDSPLTETPSVDSVIELILHRNPEVHSYVAHAVLDVRQVDFPYLHPVLNGEVYYQAPGYTVYNFPNTPWYLEGITHAEGAMGMATRWEHCYDITVHVQPDAFVLHMIPKIRGEVTALDVTVNKKTGDLQHFNWWYQEPNDGVSLTQYYTNVGGYDVVTLQQSDVTRHHIRAKLTGTFDSFQYNVPVPTPTPTPSNPLHQCDN